MRTLLFLLALSYQSLCFAEETAGGLSHWLSKENILIAIITGFVGLIPLVAQALSNRARHRSHGHRLANLAAELEFLERLTNLQKAHPADGIAKQADSPNAKVSSDLENILAQYRSLSGRKEAHEKKQIHEVSLLRRPLLLFLPVSRKGWIYHTLFYVLMWSAVGTYISELLNPVIDNEFSLLDLFIGLVVMFSVPLIVLSRKANRERKLHIEMQNAASALV